MLAFLVDLLTAVVIAQVGAAPVQLLAPPDSLSSTLPGLIFGLVLGFLYLGLATPVLGNSLGKWLFTLKIVGSDGQQIRFGGWLARLLTTGLWPINAMMVLWSTSRRHLGDRLAHSVVVMVEPKRNLLLAMAAAALVVVIGLRLGGAAMTVGVLRSSAWAAARQHLAKQQPGQSIATLPEGYHIANDAAEFDAKVGESYRRVSLVREGMAWRVVDSQPLDEPSGGTHFRFDVTSADPAP
jgi:uncharacterized RDD family membrane protein YckC